MIGAVIAGFTSGIISGMGIGGGAVLIPALLMIADISQKTAQGINLIYFIPTAVCALAVHIRQKNVEVKTALIIGVFGVFGSLAGAWSASVINDGLLRRIFGVFLAGIGVYEIFCGLKGDFVKK